MSFMSAEDVEYIARTGYEAPHGWPAGVMNHGKYYGWWRIEDRPVLFAVSLAGFILTVVPLEIAVLREYFSSRKESHSKSSSDRET